MPGQEVVFGKRGGPAKNPPPGREAPSQAFLAASEAARAAFLRGDWDREPDAEPGPAARPAARDDEADMRRFVGANWPGYRDVWLAMKDAAGLAPSRSLAAAAFTGLWLLYRKRYALGLMVMALQFGVTIVMPGFGALIDLALALAFGRYGKAIVVRDGLAAIAAIRGEGGAADEASLRIARAGGTSLLAPIAGALVALWLVFAASGEAAGDAGALLGALLGDTVTQTAPGR
jgi:hypothetical protein